MENYPTLHKPVPLRSRVIVPAEITGEPRLGIVTGIAFMHVIFIYIVTLDEPLKTPLGVVTTITCPGSLFEKPGGGNWRFKP